MKGSTKGWVQVDVDKFKENETEIQFGVRKEQHGPVVYEDFPIMGSIVDKYLPDLFIFDMIKHSEDYAIKRKSLRPDFRVWRQPT
eukprot:9433009-Ditylum_brightwellii.AAC.1